MLKIENLPPKARAQAENQMNGGKSPTSKYHNRKSKRQGTDGRIIRFDSQKEAKRFDELLVLLQAGQIKDLKLQPQFTLQEAYTTPDGIRVQAIRYRADFSYQRLETMKYQKDGGCSYEYCDEWVKIVEDVKSHATKTRVYEMKKKLLRERFGIEIAEV